MNDRPDIYAYILHESKAKATRLRLRIKVLEREARNVEAWKQAFRFLDNEHQIQSSHIDALEKAIMYPPPPPGGPAADWHELALGFQELAEMYRTCCIGYQAKIRKLEEELSK